MSIWNYNSDRSLPINIYPGEAILIIAANTGSDRITLSKIELEAGGQSDKSILEITVERDNIIDPPITRNILMTSKWPVWLIGRPEELDK